MRCQARWAAVSLAILVLAGCTSPSSVPKPDRSPGPQAVGSCRAEFVFRYTPAAAARPVDCAGHHAVEALWVGTLGESDLQPEGLTSAARARSEMQCDEQAAAVLGAQWRDYRVNLNLSWPDGSELAAGQRWMRCDAYEVDSVTGSAGHARDGAIAAALPSLKLGCFQTIVEPGAADGVAVGGKVEATAVDCAQRHNTEYVGSLITSWTQWVFQAPADRTAVGDGCQDRAAEFVGVQAGRDVRAIALPVPNLGGSDGALGFRCLLWLGDNTMTGSAKGRAVGVPPFVR